MACSVTVMRRNMITQQIRAWGVLDSDILNLFTDLPREAFVPEAYRALAFADMPTPLGGGRVMLPPKEEGRILQAVAVKPTESVLLIGTNVGYLTALLAHQAKHVFSTDHDKDMLALAEKNLVKQGIHNVTLEEASGLTGLPNFAPFDVIVLSASVVKIPGALRQQLAVGGRLFAILGEAPAMAAMLLVKQGENVWHEAKLYETVVPRLPGVQTAATFEF